VDISFTVCVCVCARIWISSPWIKLTESHFARLFIGVQGMGSQMFVNFTPQKTKIGRIGQSAGHAHRDVIITIDMRGGLA